MGLIERIENGGGIIRHQHLHLEGLTLGGKSDLLKEIGVGVKVVEFRKRGSGEVKVIKVFDEGVIYFGICIEGGVLIHRQVLEVEFVAVATHRIIKEEIIHSIRSSV